jgi:hypothetical protein
MIRKAGAIGLTNRLAASECRCGGWSEGRPGVVRLSTAVYDVA